MIVNFRMIFSKVFDRLSYVKKGCIYLAMARILSLDFGAKRCGLAETDDLQILASPLDAVPTKELLTYLERYFQKYLVELLVIGLPVRADGSLSEIESEIQKCIKQLERKFPQLPLARLNERYTSKLALDAMIQMGSTKKDRRVKGNIDKISAALILQQYLEIQRNTPKT